jgi:hypothetical protein
MDNQPKEERPNEPPKGNPRPEYDKTKPIPQDTLNRGGLLRKDDKGR